jgi:cell division septum initiation protein DivIVA
LTQFDRYKQSALTALDDIEDEYNTLVNENEDLQAEIKKLETKIDNLTADHEDLNDQILRLESKITDGK